MSEVAQDLRIATLEMQLHDLLRWKQSITSLLGVAFTAFDNALSHSEKPKAPISVVTFQQAVEVAQTTISVKEIHLAPTWTPRPSPMPALAEKQPMVVGLSGPPDAVKKNTKASAETSEGPAHVKTNPVVSVSTETALVPEKASTKVAFKILDIIQRYGQNLINPELEGSTSKDQWLGRAKFAPKVELYVEAAQPIKMILPSFPWKSVNDAPKLFEGC